MYSPKKYEKMSKIWKREVSVSEKKKNGSDTDTEIGPWFRFPIPKPGFGCTLPLPTFMCHSKAITRGHNQMTCKSASCTKHTTCDFVQKRKKKEVYCTGTVCLFGSLLFTYFLIASSVLVLTILKVTFYRTEYYWVQGKVVETSLNKLKL